MRQVVTDKTTSQEIVVPVQFIQLFSQHLNTRNNIKPSILSISQSKITEQTIITNSSTITCYYYHIAVIGIVYYCDI